MTSFSLLAEKFLYSFEKTITSYLSMPNFKFISFKMAVLHGGVGWAKSAPPMCVCYPKDLMCNRVNENDTQMKKC